jgi:hypothetical protein
MWETEYLTVMPIQHVVDIVPFLQCLVNSFEQIDRQKTSQKYESVVKNPAQIPKGCSVELCILSHPSS